jgi:RNA polymerase subunit RPABC4/transcription elongation factor Spt4
VKKYGDPKKNQLVWECPRCKSLILNGVKYCGNCGQDRIFK